MSALYDAIDDFAGRMGDGRMTTRHQLHRPRLANSTGHGLAEIIGISSEHWIAEAACGKVANPNIFFPDSKESAEPAKQICKQCPVQIECLAFALKFPPDRDHGVWGGRHRSQAQPIPKGFKRCDDCGATFLNSHGLSVHQVTHRKEA